MKSSLIRPVITEKTLHLANEHQYTFEVDRRANAIEIAQSVTQHYKVTVIAVRVLNVAGTVRRSKRGSGLTRRWKKAMVTIDRKQTIPGFEIEVEKPTDTKSAVTSEK